MITFKGIPLKLVEAPDFIVDDVAYTVQDIQQKIVLKLIKLSDALIMKVYQCLLKLP